jgi:hypothetical protein
MRTAGRLLGIAAGLLLALRLLSQPASPVPCGGRIAEEGLRKTFATRIVDPTYPESAIRAKVTGIVVAQVCVPAGSKVVGTVRISTAPSPDLAEAVEQALAQWRFGPMWPAGRPSEFLPYNSKVVYYFIESDGQWLVRSPGDSFYVGPAFALRQQRIPR